MYDMHCIMLDFIGIYPINFGQILNAIIQTSIAVLVAKLREDENKKSFLCGIDTSRISNLRNKFKFRTVR